MKSNFNWRINRGFLITILFLFSGCDLFNPDSPELHVTIQCTSTNNIEITWNDIPDVSIYRVEKMVNSSWSVQVQSYSTTYTETGLSPNTTYQYRITAVFPGGGANDISKVVSITTPVPEFEVTITALSTTSIKIIWNDVNADEYRVEKMVESEWSVKRQSAILHSYNDTGLAPNTTYQYRITAVFHGKDDISEVVSVTTTTSPVSEFEVTITALSMTSIKIVWNDVPDIAIYRVEKMVNSSWSVRVQSYSTTYTETGLSPNTTYQYRITAVFPGGGANDISKIVSITTSPGNITPKYSKDYWGEWIAMPGQSIAGTGMYYNLLWKKTYITSDQIYIGDESISRALGSAGSGFTLTSLSDNVKIISFSDHKVYLFANRIKNGSFSGTIAEFNSAGRYVRSVAEEGGWGRKVVRSTHLANQIDTTTVTTDANGAFTVEDVIPGDTYQVEVDGQTAIITPATDEANIGTITLAESVNFKTSLIPPDIAFDEDNFWFPTTLPASNIDFTRLYADGTNYSFYIYIENTGTEDALACTYSLILDDGLTLVSGSTSGILGTIEPGSKKTRYLPLTVNSASVQDEYDFKTIRIQITDPIQDKTWNDSVSLRFNKEHVTFNIAAQSSVQGVILAPTGKAYPFSGTDQSVVVPWSSRDYLVVFCGASANTETVYSLGIDTAPDRSFSGFIDLAKYEPNDTEANACVINRQGQIMSYLHKGDFDYYRIKL